MVTVTAERPRTTRRFAVVEPVLFSYSQVLFTRNRLVGLALLLATLIKPLLGAMGLLSVLVSFLIVRALRLSPVFARDGVFGYNPLLVGLALGAFLEPSPATVALVVFGAAAVVFVQAALESLLRDLLRLPVLSLPFVLVTLTLLAVVPLVAGVEPVSFNEPWQMGGLCWLPSWGEYYLRTLGAIFFQPELVSGLLVMVALLLFSRIALLLSFIGAAVSYGLLVWVFGFPTPLGGLIVGCNMVLTVIALGGLWFVPGRSAFALATGGSLIAGVVTVATIVVLGRHGLPALILPFNLTVGVTLFAMRQRVRDEAPKSVEFVSASPEASLHYWRTRSLRFGARFPLRLRLPFQGAWTVTQGVEGEHTHREQWRHAWDFEVLDSAGRSHEGDGSLVEQYHCYKLPVLAIADGTVVNAVRNVPDNPVGNRNPRDPWGNLVLIQHGGDLFSFVCHLALDSVRVVEGQFVRKGMVLGLCGNSGRSFVPHLHVHFQSTPRIGAPTVESEFHDVVAGNPQAALYRFHVPALGDTVRTLQRQADVAERFSFLIGATWRFEVTPPRGKTRIEEVVSGVDLYNNLYLESKGSGARLFFENQNNQFVTYDQRGPRDGVPALLALAAPRVPYEQRDELRWDDVLPRRHIRWPLVASMLDLVSPFLPADNVLMQYRAEWEGATLVIRGQGTAGAVPIVTEAHFAGEEGPSRISVSVGKGTLRARIVRFVAPPGRGDSGDGSG